MNRLIHERGDDPLALRAGRLADAAAPPGFPPEQEARIRARFVAGTAARPWWHRPSARAGIVAAVVVAGLVVHQLRAPHEAPAERWIALGEPVSTPVAPPAQATPIVVPVEPIPAKPTRKHMAAPSVATEPPAAPVSPMRRAEPTSSSLVFDAARALHHDHAPARALALLDDYQKLEPDGDLLEECLALVVEAKAQLDDGTAVASARAYLARFPHGRFHDQTLRTLNDLEK